MRAIKTTTISILAVGLLAGSAVGVAAQDEAESATQDVRFLIRLTFTNPPSGEFTPIGDIPAGSVSVQPGSEGGPGPMNTTYVLDPAPAGGDTLMLVERGGEADFLERGQGYAPTNWYILSAFSTGEYEGVDGKGRSLHIGDPEARTTHSFFVGTVEMPEPPAE